jgi:multidrug efflux pump subunit AcrB
LAVIIIMTLASIGMAWALAPKAGAVMLGGLMVSTVFTLFLVPSLFKSGA